MLKRKYLYIGLIGMASAVGCTKNFEKINVNPTTLTDLSTDALFTRTQLDVSGGEYEAWRTNFIYTTQFVQQFASTSWPQGDKYFFDEGYSSSLWDTYMGGAVKNLVNLIEKTKDKPEDINYNSVARILKAYAFQRLTDLYGDVPYTEAGKGYIAGIFAPKYDTQEFIYNDLLKELDEAGQALDATKPLKGDISYNGDVALWKKAANSLMLRVAMRLTEVNETLAAQWASKAVQGGVFESYEESLVIKHLEGQYDNPNSHVLGYYNGARNELAAGSFKFSKTFIDWLNAKDDPRLGILSVVRQNGTENGDPAVQKGLPSGTDPNNLPSPIDTYSQLRSDFVKANAPNVLISHGETLLLEAEAAARGYITGNAEQLFREGVKSSIDQLNLYSPTPGLINEADVTAYANSVAFPGDEAGQIQAIAEQYYIVTLLDGYEAFANWRRTGFPALTPVNFPGNYTGGVIPTRMQYPASELGLNKANLDEAVARQGQNTFTTKVWWDK